MTPFIQSSIGADCPTEKESGKQDMVHFFDSGYFKMILILLIKIEIAYM